LVLAGQSELEPERLLAQVDSILMAPAAPLELGVQQGEALACFAVPLKSARAAKQQK